MLKIIDLFSGVGGLSLGAVRAGFELAGAIELDEIAIQAHKINFPNSKHLQADVSSLTGEDIMQKFSVKKGEIDGLIGGPPCQGFSSMGKRDINDSRNMLFTHFFRLIREIQPKFFIAENVPGILDEKYKEIRQEAYNLLGNDYIVLNPLVLNAKGYGAPTSRTRVFFIGYKKGMLQEIDISLFEPSENNKLHYVQDALLGLPLDVEIVQSRRGSNEHHWIKVEKTELGTYPRLISKFISENVGDAEAKNRYEAYGEITGMIGTRHTQEVLDRYSKVKQGEVDRISRSYRLKMDGFCPTLRAGTNSDRGSYQAVRPIHPIIDRVITPREAARMQGFPDWFQFHNTKWHSFRLIGNSVSPIMSEYILSVLIKNII